MEMYYNAFISYRHHPKDIRVAKDIQRLLEHFKVPAALKKRGSTINRLFRDKDELRLTTSLTDSITTALKNSEYLIVICSTHTAESTWVQQEIEAFLLTHDRSKVLSVLVDGEPSEVIPDILLHQAVTDPETEEIRQETLEPLSCDWRIGRRRALREELPRLAAELLHCEYDELRQRQKQYRTQRLLVGGSTVLALSLGLAAYFLYTSITIRNANVQIQENYTQALRNQSKYLTTAAEDRMKNGDQLTALALLLDALPNEENQRPYVAEAEGALAEVLGVYSAKGDMVDRGALVPDEAAVVTDFVLTDDGSYIYLLDSRNIITVWNTQSLLLEATIASDMKECKLFSVTATGDLLLRAYYGDGENYTQCYRPDGVCLWQIEGYMADVAFQGNKEVKGLLSLMLSLPDGWDYTTKGLARICKDGVDSICATVKELEQAGYIVRERIRNPNGQLGAIEYTILEQPRSMPPEREKPERENPVQAEPVLGKPEQENPGQLNTYGSSTQGSKKDLSNTHGSNPIQPYPSTGPWMGTDGMESRNIYRQIVLENIGYEALRQEARIDQDQLDEIVELIVDTVCSARAVIRVAGDDFPAEVVKSRFLKLDGSHIRYVLDSMRENTTYIRNIKQYLLAALYNAPATMGNYYAALVNHDLYGSGQRGAG